MIAEILVGPQALSDGVQARLRGNRDGSAAMVQAHGRYHEAVSRGKVFLAANSATQALSVNSTTATGLILTNPANSGVNLSVLEICVALASLPAGQSSLIVVGSTDNLGAAVTHTTPLTIRNGIVGGGGNSAAKADSAATVPTGAILRHLGGGPAATVAGSTSFPPFIRDETTGLLLLPPNTYLSVQALTTAVTALTSIMWEEVPILAA